MGLQGTWGRGGPVGPRHLWQTAMVFSGRRACHPSSALPQPAWGPWAGLPPSLPQLRAALRLPGGSILRPLSAAGGFSRGAVRGSRTPTQGPGSHAWSLAYRAPPGGGETPLPAWGWGQPRCRPSCGSCFSVLRPHSPTVGASGRLPRVHLCPGDAPRPELRRRMDGEQGPRVGSRHPTALWWPLWCLLVER